MAERSNLFLSLEDYFANGALHASGQAGFGAGSSNSRDLNFGVAERFDSNLFLGGFTANGALGAVGDASFGAGGSLTSYNFFLVAERGNNFLSLYDLAANGALGASGQTGVYAVSCNSGNFFLGVSDDGNFFLSLENLAANGALGSGGQTSLGAGGSNGGDFFLGVTERGGYFLLDEDFAANRALQTSGETGFGAGSFNSFDDLFGVAAFSKSGNYFLLDEDLAAQRALLAFGQTGFGAGGGYSGDDLFRMRAMGRGDNLAAGENEAANRALYTSGEAVHVVGGGNGFNGYEFMIIFTTNVFIFNENFDDSNFSANGALIINKRSIDIGLRILRPSMLDFFSLEGLDLFTILAGVASNAGLRAGGFFYISSKFPNVLFRIRFPDHCGFTDHLLAQFAISVLLLRFLAGCIVNLLYSLPFSILFVSERRLNRITLRIYNRCIRILIVAFSGAVGSYTKGIVASSLFKNLFEVMTKSFASANVSFFTLRILLAANGADVSISCRLFAIGFKKLIDIIVVDCLNIFGILISADRAFINLFAHFFAGSSSGLNYNIVMRILRIVMTNYAVSHVFAAIFAGILGNTIGVSYAIRGLNDLGLALLMLARIRFDNIAFVDYLTANRTYLLVFKAISDTGSGNRIECLLFMTIIGIEINHTLIYYIKLNRTASAAGLQNAGGIIAGGLFDQSINPLVTQSLITIFHVRGFGFISANQTFLGVAFILFAISRQVYILIVMLASSSGLLSYLFATCRAGLLNLAILSAGNFRDNILNPLVSVLSENSLVFIAALVAERAFILTNTINTVFILFGANSSLQNSFKLPVMAFVAAVYRLFFTFSQ